MPASSSPYVYYWYAGPTANCYASEGAALSDELAYIDSSTERCNSTFDSWREPWPGGEGVTGYQHVCPAPGVPITWGAQRTEQRTFDYLHTMDSNCSGTPTSEINGFARHKFYYCQDPNYELYSPPNGGGALIPSCRLLPDKIDKLKPPCAKCQKQGAPDVGNPINTATGVMYHSQLDYRGAGLTFERTYNTQANASGVLGSRWMHSYDLRLEIRNITSVATVIVAHRKDGREIQFRNFSGIFTVPWTQDADLVERIAPVGMQWKLTNAEDAVELYDSSGRLLSITSRAGAITSLSYDLSNRLATVADPHGRTLSFGYDGGNRINVVTIPGGGTYQYAYDVSGNLTTVTAPDLTTRVYVYNPLLTDIIDESSQTYESWQYDAQLRATRSEHAGGVDRTTVAYNVDGTRTITDALGATHTQTHTIKLGVPKLSALTGSLCASCGHFTSYSYDGNGNLSEQYDTRGTRFAFSYSSDGRNLLTEEFRATGTAVTQSVSTSWHSSFRLPTSITEANRTTSFTHDANGNALTRTVTDTSVVPNVARTWTYTYNAFGKVLTENGPRTDVSDVTTYTYYTCATGFQCGQLNTITNALSHVTTYNSYNAHGQPTQITDPNGLVTSLAYDARQRMTDRCTGSTLPACTGGELTHLDYWPTGLLKKVTNPDASYIQYTYDAAHRLTQINDGASNKIVYTLDNMGNRTAENSYDPSLVLKRTHSRVFNTLNQLWKDVNAAGTVNVTTVFGYDSNGNQNSVAAPLSRNSSSLYDELNRLKQITDPNSGVTLFGYDANDNLTSVTDPRTLATTYTYTGFGDLKTQTSPDTGLTTNTYDSGGNLKTSTDARSAITTYTYDVANRVNTVAYKIGATTDQTFTYTYDGGVNQKGRLTGATDGSNPLAWSYDVRGRVVGKAQTFAISSGTSSLSIGYGYNSLGQLFHVVLPSGKAITYGYNGNGQVSSVTLDGSPSTTILNNITYDPFGPITGWTWGNGTASTTRTFDTDGKLTALSNTPSTTGNRTFGYDDAFRITSTTDSASGGPSWTLGYDVLDRLNSATKPSTTIGYTYDANGNRLSQTGTSASTYTVSGSSNRLSSTSGALVRSYLYDNSGSVTSSGATTHTYYNSGRMKTGKLGAAAVTTYLYNALGQRIKKGGGAIATTVYFAYDEAGHLVGEYNINSSTGAITAVQETVWVGDIPVATLRAGSGAAGVFYVHTDQLNTPRKVTVASGTDANKLRWKWDPSPFGDGSSALNENPAAIGTFKYNLRFPGQYFDLESNLNYNYFRDYEPALGRFVQSDPIGLRDGMGTYNYGKNSPPLSRDPFGLSRLGPDSGPKEDWGPSPTGPSICGADGGKKFPMKYGLWSLENTCRNHDRCYGTCGMSRLQCDDRFLEDARDECRNSLVLVPSPNVACQKIAIYYYQALRQGGRDAYIAAQKEKPCCNIPPDAT